MKIKKILTSALILLMCLVFATPLTGFTGMTNDKSKNEIVEVGANSQLVSIGAPTVFMEPTFNSSGARIYTVAAVAPKGKHNGYAANKQQFRITVNDKNAYCIELGVPIWDDDNVTQNASKVWNSLSLDKRKAIQTAICFGEEKGKGSYNRLYGKAIQSIKSNSGKTVSTDEVYIAAQLIVWEIIREDRDSIAPFNLIGNSSGILHMFCAKGKNGNIKLAYNYIINEMRKFQKAPSFTSIINIDSKVPVVDIIVRVNSNGTISSQEIELDDKNAVLDRYPSLIGNHTLSDGTVVNVSKHSTKANTLVVKCTTVGTTVGSGGTAVSETVSSQKQISVPTSGSSLILYGSDKVQDCVVGGTVDPPNAYIKFSVRQPSVECDGRILKCCVTDEEKNNSSLAKGSGSIQTPENVEGWYFRVTPPAEFVSLYGVDSFILGPTDSLGYTPSISDYIAQNIDPLVTHGVPEGTYTITEELGKLKDGAVEGSTNESDYEIPDEWELDSLGEINISKTGEAVNIGYVTNVLNIPLKLKKVNNLGATTNWYFKLYNEDTDEVYILKSEKNGYMHLVGESATSNHYMYFPSGTYTLSELGKLNSGATVGSMNKNDYNIPSYYDIPSDITFEISSDTYNEVIGSGKDAIEYTITNTASTKIVIKKYDKYTKEPLSGATFELYYDAECTALASSGTTNSDGILEFEGKYTLGEYYIKETKAPTYYQLNSEITPVTVQTQDITTSGKCELILYNEPIKSYIKITKRDRDTGELVSGAAYGIYSSNTKDSNGMLLESNRLETIVLSGGSATSTNKYTPGTYYIQEIKAPTYYELNKEVYTVTVTKTTNNNKTISKTVYDSQNPSRILIKKVDNQTGAQVSGAVYGIYTDQSCTALQEQIASVGSGYTYSRKTYKPGVYFVKEVTAPFGYALDDTVYTVVVAQTKTSIGQTKVDVSDDIIPSLLRVKKVDELTGEPLEGALFYVYYIPENSESINGVYVGSIKTGASGYGYARDENGRALPCYPGTYRIAEIKAPDGYRISNHNTEVVIEKTSNEDNVVTVTIENAPKVYISVYKTDKYTGEPLEASFMVFQQLNPDGSLDYSSIMRQGDTHWIYAYTDKETGKAVFDFSNANTQLVAGRTYYVVESNYPDGYTSDSDMDNNIYPVTPTYENNTPETAAEVHVKNERKRTNVTIKKVDGATNTALAGAQFKMYKSDGTPVKYYTISEAARLYTCQLYEGQYSVTSDVITVPVGGFKLMNVPNGDYYLEEVVAPNGYTKLTTKISFTADYNLSDNEIVVKNYSVESTTAAIKIYKRDQETNKPLSGAVFAIYKESDRTTPLSTVTTDSTGYGTFPMRFELNQAYFIKEISAPKNYLLKNNSTDVYINSSQGGSTITQNFSNKKLTGYIAIEKTCEQTGNFVAGATYGLYSSNEKSGNWLLEENLLSTVVTDENGYGVFDTPVRIEENFYIQEITAPTGYARNSTVYTVKSTKQNTEASSPNLYKVTDRLQTGQIILKKVDGTKGDMPIKGVKFNIFTADGKGVSLSGPHGNIWVYERTGGEPTTITTQYSSSGEYLNLPVGDYYAVELSTVAGMMVYGDKIYFSVKPGEINSSSAVGQTITVRNFNTVLSNTGENGNYLCYTIGLISLFFGISSFFVFYRVRKRYFLQ